MLVSFDVRLKQSPLAYIQLWMQNNVLCGLPDSMQQQMAMDVFSRHSLVWIRWF
jgi:hypothetical protein